MLRVPLQKRSYDEVLSERRAYFKAAADASQSGHPGYETLKNFMNVSILQIQTTYRFWHGREWFVGERNYISTRRHTTTLLRHFFAGFG